MSPGLSAFTLIHVLISLVTIVSGLVVVFGMIDSKPFDGWTAFFLTATMATSVTGFFFPFHGVTPALVLGVLSMIVLTLSILERYRYRIAGHRRWIYVVTAVTALYFNFFRFDRAVLPQDSSIPRTRPDADRGSV